ncbi:PREDICTED: DUF724 domain-containing protein 2 [Tarenaya hassleriana]|uniref:DUF724 domain-containing protein 2 n=1 Tax=Tarenaya hassleriana TaxID=28532 RepID=UPI00053C12DB|nr:PREDICTED: DUF724 domain-containing protein 2 [Tarenaya hassleriana]
MEFVRGDHVEVCSREEGFLGSYFAATVVERLAGGKFYKVKYKNLVTEEDEFQPLMETISAAEIRPSPPRYIPVVFRRRDAVDAFDNDGWWVGEVTGRKDNLFSVYFRTTGDEIEYPFNRLRAHVDWVNGQWVSPPSSSRGL